MITFIRAIKCSHSPLSVSLTPRELRELVRLCRVLRSGITSHHFVSHKRKDNSYYGRLSDSSLIL